MSLTSNSLSTNLQHNDTILVNYHFLPGIREELPYHEKSSRQFSPPQLRFDFKSKLVTRITYRAAILIKFSLISSSLFSLILTHTTKDQPQTPLNYKHQTTIMHFSSVFTEFDDKISAKNSICIVYRENIALFTYSSRHNYRAPPLPQATSRHLNSHQATSSIESSTTQNHRFELLS